ATLAPDDLVAGREGDVLELTRGQETELPQALKWQVARADGADNRAKYHRLNAANRRRGGCVGWQVRDPAIFALQHIVGNQAELGEVVRCVRRAELAFEVWAADVGPRALVVDHVVRCQRDVAVQV